MKYLKLFEAVRITDEMKQELDSLNHNLTLEEVENLFVDFIEYGSEIIEFTSFDKRYEVNENSRTINYIDGDSRNGSIERPATYLTYTITIGIKILDISRADEYLEKRQLLNSNQIQNIIGHNYGLLSRFIKFPNGEYSKDVNGYYIDELKFYPKNILWLKKFGSPTYGLNKKYINSFYESLRDTELDNIIDLTLVSLKDDGFNIGVARLESGSMIVIRLGDHFNFSINPIMDNLLTFFDIIQKRYELLNIICYDENSNEYALKDHEKDYIYQNKFYTIDKLFDKVSELMIDGIYIVVK